MIAVLDYGAGNLRSVEKALRHIGCDVAVTGDAEVLRREAEVRVENGMATATLHCTLLEDIAEEVEMTAEERAEAEAKLLEPPM